MKFSDGKARPQSATAGRCWGGNALDHRIPPTPSHSPVPSSVWGVVQNELFPEDLGAEQDGLFLSGVL